jgi:hypothetical protein
MKTITKIVNALPNYCVVTDFNGPVFEFVWDIMHIFWIYKIDNSGIATKIISIYE